MMVLPNIDEIRNIENLSEYSSIIIFGVGSHIYEVLSFFRSIHLYIECICDSNIDKQGKKIDDMCILSPKEALSKYKPSETAVVMGIVSWQSEISKQLRIEYHVLESDIYSFHSDYSNEFMYSYEIIYSSEELIRKAYGLLSDEESKCLYENIIKGKITRNPRYFESNPCMLKPYFYNNDGIQIMPRGICIDAGAFIGDTAEYFLDFPQVTKVICIEPLKGNYDEILQRTRTNQISANIEVIHSALGEEKGEIYIYSNSNISVSASTNNRSNAYSKEKVVLSTLDELFFDRKNVDFIKFDIEGSEMDALHGGINMLHKFKPSLMVSAYHYTQHLWEIPLLLHDEFPEAKIYLGHQINAPFEPEYYIHL